MSYSNLPASVIEDADEHMDALAELMEIPVSVTELLNGRHWCVTATRRAKWEAASPDNVVLHVAHYGDPLRYAEDIDVLRDQRLDFVLCDLMVTANEGIDSITLRGEYLDERTVYGLERPEVRLFDVEVNGDPLDARHALPLFNLYAVKHVPVLSLPLQTLYQWLNRRPVGVAASALSKLAAVDREGVVIRPAVEMTHRDLGRFILKVVAH